MEFVPYGRIVQVTMRACRNSAPRSVLHPSGEGVSVAKLAPGFRSGSTGRGVAAGPPPRDALWRQPAPRCCSKARLGSHPDTEAWSWTGTMGSPVEFPPAALLYDGRVLRTWGTEPEVSDPVAGTWAPGRVTPTAGSKAWSATSWPSRDGMLLRYFDDLSAEERARRQDLPSSTVRNRLKRGLEQLRIRLEHDWLWVAGSVADEGSSAEGLSPPECSARPNQPVANLRRGWLRLAGLRVALIPRAATTHGRWPNSPTPIGTALDAWRSFHGHCLSVQSVDVRTAPVDRVAYKSLS